MSQYDNDTKQASETIDNIYRAHSRHVFATLVRLLGDFDVAEEALHEAFRVALEQWPGAWLGSVEVRPIAEDARTIHALGLAAAD